MIVNHKYKFIFLKTKKTAGTSLEIALSQLCGSDDIISPLGEDEEKKRHRLGFRGSQNYDVPLRRYTARDWLRLLVTGRRRYFFQHAPAWYVRQKLGKDIWNSYFKFCFERNPFDKAISRYYWRMGFWKTEKEGNRPSIEDFLESRPTGYLSNWGFYTINDRIAVDFVGRYENFTEDLATVMHKVGVSTELSLPRAKGNFRKDKTHYSKVLNSQARTRIEQECANEIAAFSYEWEEV